MIKINARLWLVIYSFFAWVTLILLLPYYVYLIIIKGKYRKNILYRLCLRFPEWFNEPLNSKPRIWLHAVSVGEAVSLSPVIMKINDEYPGTDIYLSVTTETGFDVAKKKYSGLVKLFYLPLDIPFLIKKFIERIKPAVILIAETEIWPGLIVTASHTGIPVGIIHGRLTHNSFVNYQLFSLMFRRVFDSISFYSVQGMKDFLRFSRLGIPEKKISIDGFLKIDALIEKSDSIKHKSAAGNNHLVSREDLGYGQNDIIWICGSVHPPEIPKLVNVFHRLKKDHPDLYLILAPRHPDVCLTKKTLNCINEKNMSFQFYSKIKPGNKPGILLVDEMGVLGGLYSVANVVFVGGSLIPHGGQNILEPAVYGCPVVFGRYMHNFEEISNIFLSESIGKKIKSLDSLERVLREWIGTIKNGPDDVLRYSAEKIFRKYSGTTDKIIRRISPYIKVRQID